PAVCTLEQALHGLHDRSELRVDDVEAALSVATARMVSSEQLQVSSHCIQRRPVLVSKRRRYLADCRHPFRMRETLLRSDQISIGGTQFSRGEVNLLHQCVIQTADLTQ